MSHTRIQQNGQLRLIDTPNGPIRYVLVRKQVKNLTLRVSTGGLVTLTVPVRVSDQRAEEFLKKKSGWIVQTLTRQEEEQAELLPEPAREKVAELLNQSLARVYPLIAPLGVAFPILKLRTLKSQWGNCHWAQGYITLNTALARCPERLRDYVALHELVHFLHHDHGPGFYSTMDTLMPDWQMRRKELRGYGRALKQ